MGRQAVFWPIGTVMLSNGELQIACCDWLPAQPTHARQWPLAPILVIIIIIIIIIIVITIIIISVTLWIANPSLTLVPLTARACSMGASSTRLPVPSTTLRIICFNQFISMTIFVVHFVFIPIVIFTFIAAIPLLSTRLLILFTLLAFFFDTQQRPTASILVWNAHLVCLYAPGCGRGIMLTVASGATFLTAAVVLGLALAALRAALPAVGWRG